MCCVYVFSVFDQSLPLHDKDGKQTKNSYFRAEGSGYESAGQLLFMQSCCAKVRVWKITDLQDQDLIAKFIYMYMDIYY